MQDFFKENSILFNKKSPETCSLLENTSLGNEYITHPSKSGAITLSKTLPNGLSRNLHSNYDPIQEASRLIDTYISGGNSIYILNGLGLGYHLIELVKRVSSHARIIIIEKNPLIARLAFTYSDFTSVINHPGVTFLIEIDPACLEHSLYEDRTNLAVHGYTLIDFKPLIELEKAYYTSIKEELAQVHQKFQMDINTQAAFSKKFYKNIFDNGQSIIESPGIASLKDMFYGTPAIMVSAGPSLDKNISLIKSARNNIIIVTVATALNPLLINGIRPDFVVAVDPDQSTHQSFDMETIPEDLWMIYDPCVPSSITSLFKGRSIAVDSKIYLAKWLSDNNEEKGTLGNVFSVAHSAFYISRYMGCNPVILVGQDLSFEGHRMHCTDSFYDQARQDDISADRTLDVLEYHKYRECMPSITPALNVFDEYSNTTKAMETYKYQFKNEMTGKFQTLNATEGGVNIPGAEHITLREALNNYCFKEIGANTSSLKMTIKSPKINKNLSTLIIKQKDKFTQVSRTIERIENKYLPNADDPKNKKEFVTQMEGFYKKILEDPPTIHLMQGYNYTGFVEWNQKTHQINDTNEEISDDDIISRKCTRDITFLSILKETVEFLSKGFEKWTKLH